MINLGGGSPYDQTLDIKAFEVVCEAEVLLGEYYWSQVKMRFYQIATMILMIFSLQPSRSKQGSAIVPINKQWHEKRQKDFSKPKDITTDQI